MDNQFKDCERCHEQDATKIFFLFNEENQIKINSKVCDFCFSECGFDTAEPALAEVFAINRDLQAHLKTLHQ
jgi:hypothetical protein